MASEPPVDLSHLRASAPDAAGILGALAAAVNGLPAADPASPDRAAAAIDELYPAGRPAADVEAFLWSLWTLLIGTARKLPADDRRQQLLVDTLRSLRARRDDAVELWGQQTRVWGELPMLGPCMREAWNTRQDLEDAPDKADAAAVRAWVSLNSFVARVLCARLQSWDNFAVWELRAALETQPPTAPAARDAALATACEWITHAGEELHAQGRRARTFDGDEERVLAPGKLFAGKPGLSDERWRFWRERLGVLAVGAGSRRIKDRVQWTVHKMDELEGSGSACGHGGQQPS